MAHQLETINGKTAFVSARETPWHCLGQIVDHSLTAEEVMTEALLGGWNVRKTPLLADLGNGGQVAVPNMNSVIRDNPVTRDPELLAAGVSDRYTIIQNEEHAQFLNDLVDESGAHFETAGSLYGGKQTFISMKIGEGYKIAGVDPMDYYITALNSHDGTLAFTILVTPVRVVCANTLNIALREHKAKFAMRHTRHASTRIQEVRESLELTFDYMDEFQVEANKMIQTTLTERDFEDIVSKNWGPGKDSSPQAQTAWDKKFDTLMDLFAEAGTQEGIRDTVWAGFNALTEYNDHYTGARSADPQAARAVRAIFEPEAKQKAYKVFSALV